MKVLVLLALLGVCSADVYLQSPKGSNNRLDEANRDRNNGNRLFDSQNNNRGGYNVGNVALFESSKVSIQWTNQHSCSNDPSKPNDPNMVGCEMIIQYLCDDKLRDGTTTNTIPVQPIQCDNWDCDTDVRFGRQESWDSYMSCTSRERNAGLFTSTQTLKGNTAQYTRQNPNGARRGYECPEERDYYPYWHPTNWRDAAILTNQAGRCEAYKAESQNVAPRYFCDLPYTAKAATGNPIPITQAACELVDYPGDNGTAVVGVWTMVPAFNIAAPDCQENWWSRDNHLGNVEGGQTSAYEWTVPGDIISSQCSLRVRYNISTGDGGVEHFDGPDVITSAELTAELNGEGKSGKKARTGPAKVDIAGAYLIEAREDAIQREYILKNNPQVDAFGALVPGQKLQLQLAVNTAQYGRTFQDRTHRLAFQPRPEALQDVTIHNMLVRGKRGNIVQTYPGTEYDFSRADFNCKNGEYVQFQWSGSNTNPNNNAGQGKQGTDRHNVLLNRAKHYTEVGQPAEDVDPPVYGQLGNSYPAQANDPSAPFLGLSVPDKKNLAVLSGSGELSELDDADTYFDLGAKMCAQNGVYNYMSTRNNNFSNRSEKERFTVSDAAESEVRLSDAGGIVSADGDSVIVEPGVLTASTPLIVTSYAREHDTGFDGSPSSNIVQLDAATSDKSLHLTNGGKVTISVAYQQTVLGLPTMYKSSSLEGPWDEVEDAEFNDGKATAKVDNTGFFLVENKTNVLAVILIVLAVLACLAGTGFLLVKKFREPALASAKNHAGGL